MNPPRRVAVLALGLAACLALPTAGSATEEGAAAQLALRVGDGRKVSIEYTLTMTDGVQVDSNVGLEPLTYEHGKGQIVSGLERALVGLSAGDTKHVEVPADQGYGPVHQDAIREVAIDQIPEEGRRVDQILVQEDDQGKRHAIRVREVRDDTIVLDFNHPLAGETLIFDVKVVEVR